MLLRASLLLIGLASPIWAQDNPNIDDPSGPALDSGSLGAKEHGEAGSGSWSVRLGYYDRDDSGGASGNPFVDESLSVIEPIIVYDKQVTDTFGYDIQFSYDRVSSASIERLKAFDAQTGATGDNYFGLVAGFRHQLTDLTNLSWHLGAATEYDYNSIGLGAGVSHSFTEKDAVLSFNLDTYFDQVTPILYNGIEEDSESRTSLAGTLSWYQVLTPRMHGEFGLTLSSQSGYLETPINAVVVENPMDPPNPNLSNNARGTEFGEALPDSRTRLALFGKVRRRMDNRNALELGARIYDDDWGIAAFDLTPRYIHQFKSGLLLDLHYRFYTQGAADAWAESFTSLPEERTQDPDLGDFDSSLLGTYMSWGGAQADTWSVSLDYLSRSDGLDHWFLGLGWKRNF